MIGKNTRLIDTQDAFNVLSDYYHHHTSAQHLALQEALNKVPTVDAVPKNDYKKALDCILTAYLNPEIRHDILEKFVFETFSVGEAKE